MDAEEERKKLGLGPGSIPEAIHLGLPVIVTRNALTMPQERYNADWVTENELGLVLGSFGGIVPGVEKMLEAGTLTHFQANARKLKNCAIFEILEILDKLLQ